MLHIVFADHRLTNGEARSQLQEHGVRLIGIVHVYPECRHVRGAYDALVRRISHLVRIGQNHTIVTDSDAILDAFRVAVKNGRIRHTQVEIHVFENERYNKLALDKDARFLQGVPPLFNYHRDLLRQLM